MTLPDPPMKLPLLTDRQCWIFLKEMREFGYPNLTFEEVRATANELHESTKIIRGDVIAVIMKQEIERAVAAAKTNAKGE